MEISWTGTTTEEEAEKQQAAIREIMRETGLPFHLALDVFISTEREKGTKND